MALKAEAEGMTRAWKGKPALRIPVLPESISVKSMADLSNNEQGIAVGLDAESIEAVHVMPGETTAMAVTGRVGCGKSAMLRRIGKMVLEIHFYIAWTQKENLWRTCRRRELLMRSFQKLRKYRIYFPRSSKN